jgi:purine-binding chemotaxis protein CheW
MSIFEHFTEAEIAILRARAERIAGEQQTGDVEATRAALSVTVRAELFALPVESMTAVYQHVSITPVPCVPPYVAGIANIRGHIVPVIDLGAFLDVPGDRAMASNPLFTVMHDGSPLAFRVEAIGNVITFTASQIAPVPTHLSDGDTLQGILPDQIALLNMSALLSDERLS